MIIIIFILFLLYALAFAMHSHYDYWRRHLLTLFVMVASTPTVQLLCFRFIGAHRNTYPYELGIPSAALRPLPSGCSSVAYAAKPSATPAVPT